ncbi:hypothetical protein [Bradyrhizobium sp. SZCCHNRI1058]|uniref:hypothetical protein n=1 Tax=Bradyrhizobium sp. SZCCHNRI1058 TaxID=3057279 RepID=UPI0029167C38|nr:hypothetical protein [Bradyrhizobium sp. SZCCHNRI1058]
MSEFKDLCYRTQHAIQTILSDFDETWSSEDVARMCAKHDAQWWMSHRFFGKHALLKLSRFVREHGFDIEGAPAVAEKKVGQQVAMKRALALAVEMLAVYEPGDSRAVSTEFVALAAVLTGDISPEVMAIIDAPRDPASFNAVLTSLEVIVS